MGCSEGIPDPWLVGHKFICAPVYTITQVDIDAGAVNKSIRWVDPSPVVVAAVAFAADLWLIRRVLHSARNVLGRYRALFSVDNSFDLNIYFCATT